MPLANERALSECVFMRVGDVYAPLYPHGIQKVLVGIDALLPCWVLGTELRLLEDTANTPAS